MKTVVSCLGHHLQFRLSLITKLMIFWAHKTEGESKKNRRTGYLVKWKDFNSFEPSYEKETTLCQFEQEIKEYWGKKLVPHCCMDGADGSVLLG